MEEKKKELILLIESIKNEDILDYIMEFTQSFSDAYTTFSQEIGAET